MSCVCQLISQVVSYDPRPTITRIRSQGVHISVMPDSALTPESLTEASLADQPDLPEPESSPRSKLAARAAGSA